MIEVGVCANLFKFDRGVLIILVRINNVSRNYRSPRVPALREEIAVLIITRNDYPTIGKRRPRLRRVPRDCGALSATAAIQRWRRKSRLSKAELGSKRGVIAMQDGAAPV